MKSRLLLSALTVVSLASCSDDKAAENTTTSTTSPKAPSSTTSTTTDSSSSTCEVTVGVDSGEDNRCEVALGSEVRITAVNPNAADELHLHDYDLTTGEMAAGEPSSIVFTADKAGEFELESHVTEEVMMILVVTE